jgi:drug/metabolite transporter (DMT)-like permease
MTVRARMLLGTGLCVMALACFATLDTTTRWVTASLGVPVMMALWTRYTIQALANTVLMLPVRGRSLLRTQHPRFQALRGTLLLLTSMFAFFSLRYIPVGEFTAIVMITPLAITVVAAWVLKEKVSRLRWLAVIGGFVGTLIIVRPGGALFNWTVVFPLASVVTNAWFQLLTSKMAKTEDALTMHFYTGWMGALLSSLALPFVWENLHTMEQVWGLLLMGATGSLGHFCLIHAYQRASAATLTPFMYSQILFGMFGGWLVFSHVPDGPSLLGMALIAACGAGGAWLAVRESRVKVL